MAFKQKIKKHIPLILLVIASITAFYFVDFDNFLKHKQQIIEIFQKNLPFSGIAYSAIYAICVALSLPVAAALTILAGLLFGVIWGTIIVVIGATLGACVIFLVIKHSMDGKSVLDKHKNNKPLKKLQKNIKENEISYLLFVRLVPIFPFVLVNIAPATIGTKLNIFFWTTLIGIIPGTAIYTYLGHSTGKITEASDIFSPSILISLTLLGLFSLIPVVIKAISKKQKR